MRERLAEELTAGGNHPDRFNEDGGFTIFEDITGGPVAQSLDDIRFIRVHGEDQDPRAFELPDLTKNFEPMQPWDAHVEEENVGFDSFSDLDGFETVRSFADHLQVFSLKEQFDPFTNKLVIFGDDNSGRPGMHKSPGKCRGRWGGGPCQIQGFITAGRDMILLHRVSNIRRSFAGRKYVNLTI